MQCSLGNAVFTDIIHTLVASLAAEGKQSPRIAKGCFLRIYKEMLMTYFKVVFLKLTGEN
jgi:hypothetical protein